MITAIDRYTALVLIDLQKGIVRPGLAHPVEEVLKNAAMLMAAFRKIELPVVIVHVDPAGAAWTKARVQSPAAASAQPPGFTDIVEAIQTQPGDIFIGKKTWSAFYNTPLDDELKKRGITGIVLGGVSTSAGVESTARAASERGYNISFATDAMTDRVAAAHDNSLAYVFPRIGELGVSAEIMEYLPVLS